MRRAGSVCRDLGASVKHVKNQLCDYMEKSQPGQLGSRHRDAGISATRAENLPCNRDCRATLSFPSPFAFFALFFSIHAFPTISEPGTGYFRAK